MLYFCEQEVMLSGCVNFAIAANGLWYEGGHTKAISAAYINAGTSTSARADPAASYIQLGSSNTYSALYPHTDPSQPDCNGIAQRNGGAGKRIWNRQRSRSLWTTTTDDR